MSFLNKISFFKKEVKEEMSQVKTGMDEVGEEAGDVEMKEEEVGDSNQTSDPPKQGKDSSPVKRSRQLSRSQVSGDPILKKQLADAKETERKLNNKIRSQENDILKHDFEYQKLQEEYNKLLKKWNELVPIFNEQEKEKKELNKEVQTWMMLEHQRRQEKVQLIGRVKQIYTGNFFPKHNKLSRLILLLKQPKDMHQYYDHKITKSIRRHIQETLLKLHPQNDCFLLDIQELDGEYHADFVVLKGKFYTTNLLIDI
jgi:hypothetical protein